MTIEEQLHTTAQLLEATARIALRNEEAIKKLIEVQELQQQGMTTLTWTIQHVGERLTVLTEAHERLTQAHERLTEGLILLSANVAEYVMDSRERMKQMEANLDALIRIITAEHSNGKGKL
jgi:hypothetical protein